MKAFAPTTARSRLVAPLALLATVLSTGALAQITPLGDQFEISSETATNQIGAEVAVAPDGTSMVVWWGSVPNVSGSFLVWGRVYGTDGTAATDAFEIGQIDASVFASSLVDPAVVWANDGTFAVAWQDAGTDPEGAGIQLRRYDGDGQPVGGVVRVDQPNDRFLAVPRLAAGPDGSVLVVFQANTGLLGVAIEGRMVAADGALLGEQESYASGFLPAMDVPTFPDVARGDDGFLVTWQRYLFNGFPPGDEDYLPSARGLDLDGGTSGPRRSITDKESSADLVAVASLADGNFVVVYPDGEEDLVIAGQIVGSDGSPIGERFAVAEFSAGNQGPPSITSNGGGFAASWASNGNIVLRLFATDGTPLSTEIVVDTQPTYGSVPDSSVAVNGDGSRLAVVWATQPGPGQSTRVYGRFGSVDCTDADADGFAAEGGLCGPMDCNDGDPAVNPGAAEIPGNGIDDDCDAATPPQSGCMPEPQSAQASVVDRTTGVQIPVDLAFFMIPAVALVAGGLRLRRRRATAS